jgi:hypothetical protein
MFKVMWGVCVVAMTIVGCILSGCTLIGAYSGMNIPLSDVPAKSSGTVQNTDEVGFVYGLSTQMMFGEHLGVSFNPQVRVWNDSTSIYENVVEDTLSFKVDGAYAWQARNVELMFASRTTLSIALQCGNPIRQ